MKTVILLKISCYNVLKLIQLAIKICRILPTPHSSLLSDSGTEEWVVSRTWWNNRTKPDTIFSVIKGVEETFKTMQVINFVFCLL